MKQNNTFLVDIVDSAHDSNVSMAKIIVVCRAAGVNEVCEGKGFSRRNPADKNHPSIGASLAAARALQAAGKRLERRINGVIKHQEDVAIMKANARPRPAELPVKKKTSQKKNYAAPKATKARSVNDS